MICDTLMLTVENVFIILQYPFNEPIRICCSSRSGVFPENPRNQETSQLKLQFSGRAGEVLIPLIPHFRPHAITTIPVAVCPWGTPAFDSAPSAPSNVHEPRPPSQFPHNGHKGLDSTSLAPRSAPGVS